MIKNNIVALPSPAFRLPAHHRNTFIGNLFSQNVKHRISENIFLEDFQYFYSKTPHFVVVEKTFFRSPIRVTCHLDHASRGGMCDAASYLLSVNWMASIRCIAIFFIGGTNHRESTSVYERICS